MSSSTWLADYRGNLAARDEVEKADDHTINAYTKLADVYAQLYQQQQTAAASEPVVQRPSAQRASSSRIPPSLLGSKAPRPSTPPSDSVTTIRLRSDLTAAHIKTQALNTQLETLQGTHDALGQVQKKAQAETAGLRKQLATLNAEKAGIERRLRDRESELREGRKLVENVQDEMVGLEMQLNVKEERVSTLERENKDLVERWMKKVGEDAKKLNIGSGWE